MSLARLDLDTLEAVAGKLAVWLEDTRRFCSRHPSTGRVRQRYQQLRADLDRRHYAREARTAAAVAALQGAGR